MTSAISVLGLFVSQHTLHVLVLNDGWIARNHR